MAVISIKEPNKKKFPFCAIGHKYAKDVLSGDIVSNIFVKGACKRYLEDLENQKDFYMDWEAAEKYLRLTQKFEHVIGHWEQKYIIYEPWQCFVWMNIMGFISRKTKYRRFRIAHIEVARGNGKSAMASQAALYFVALDNPNGNRISAVATKKDQARIVLDSARLMATKNPGYRSHNGVKVLAHKITHPASGSEINALSGDDSGLDGLNDVLAICDELHAMDRDVFDVITSGMSKRKDSLTLCITTAGQDVHSVGFSQSAFAKKICLGDVEDDSMFAIVYTLDEDDDWEDEKNWIKANPNLNVSVDLDSLRAKVSKAKETSADIPNIKIKHLNLWISEAKAYFDLRAWDKCGDSNLKIEDLEKKSSRLGLDLASNTDLASIGIVFKDEDTGVYTIFDKSYIPEDTVKSKKNTLYNDCIAKGYLYETPGAAINYGKIQGEILNLANTQHVIECLYDPWNATETAQNLSDKVEMVKISMNVGNLSAPTKMLLTLMLEGKLRHNNSPLLRWCIGNVVAKEDHNGNVFPRKSHEKLKIDPVIAIIMALAGWITDDKEESVYETRGLRII